MKKSTAGFYNQNGISMDNGQALGFLRKIAWMYPSQVPTSLQCTLWKY